MDFDETMTIAWIVATAWIHARIQKSIQCKNTFKIISSMENMAEVEKARDKEKEIESGKSL